MKRMQQYTIYLAHKPDIYCYVHRRRICATFFSSPSPSSPYFLFTPSRPSSLFFYMRQWRGGGKKDSKPGSAEECTKGWSQFESLLLWYCTSIAGFLNISDTVGSLTISQEGSYTRACCIGTLYFWLCTYIFIKNNGDCVQVCVRNPHWKRICALYIQYSSLKY